MKIRLLFLLSLSLLAGCVAPPMPLPEGYSGPRARITDTSTPVSSTKVQLFELREVDARNVVGSSESTYRHNYGKGLLLSPVVESREVPATTCTLKLAGATYVAAPILAFGGKMYFVDGTVSATLEPGKTYLVKGTLSAEYCAVWLEDSEGKIVSPKIEKAAAK